MPLILLNLLKNPKNILIILLLLAILGLGGKCLYDKAEIATLKSKVTSLATDLANEKATNQQLRQANDGLTGQIEEMKKSEIEHSKLKAQIDDLKKQCPKTILVKNPPVSSKPTVTVPVNPNEPVTPPGTKPKEDLSPNESPPEANSGGITEYTWGGEDYEQKAIQVYNNIIDWANSDNQTNDKGVKNEKVSDSNDLNGSFGGMCYSETNSPSSAIGYLS